MSQQKTVLESLAGRRLTAVEIGEILGVTEKTARKRLADGINASDVITICRAVDVNPVEALVELRFVTMKEAMDFVDSDGQLLATADQEALFLELVDRSLTTPQLADLLAARSRRGVAGVRLSAGMSRAEVEEQLSKAQALGLIPAHDPAAEVVDLGSKRSSSDFDSEIDLSDLPAVAHEPEDDPADPDDGDDHSWIP